MVLPWSAYKSVQVCNLLTLQLHCSHVPLESMNICIPQIIMNLQYIKIFREQLKFEEDQKKEGVVQSDNNGMFKVFLKS